MHALPYLLHVNTCMCTIVCVQFVSSLPAKQCTHAYGLHYISFGHNIYNSSIKEIHGYASTKLLGDVAATNSLFGPFTSNTEQFLLSSSI